MFGIPIGTGNNINSVQLNIIKTSYRIYHLNIISNTYLLIMYPSKLMYLSQNSKVILILSNILICTIIVPPILRLD